MAAPIVLGLIAARGGSKGIPGKNIKPLAGKPLMGWTIEAALQSRLDRVVVSTDDDEVARVARSCGADVPFTRPSDLAQDDSPHIPVLMHALDWLDEHEDWRPDYIMSLQATSPFRIASDINAAIELAVQHNADAVASVSETDSHPYVTKSVLPDGTLAEFISTDVKYLRRQDLPAAYRLNGDINLQRCVTLKRDRTWVPPGAMALVMPKSRSGDIDTPWDFHVANLILGARHERKVA